jgi:single-strand DNA-binding protein
MLNKHMLIGRIGKDPEIRETQFGKIVGASIATTARWKDRQTGERKEKTEWHRLDFFGETAKIAAEYLKKGMLIYAEGESGTRKYTDKTGIERYSTSVNVKNFQMLSPKDLVSPNHSDQPPGQSQAQTYNDAFGPSGDEIPF